MQRAAFAAALVDVTQSNVLSGLGLIIVKNPKCAHLKKQIICATDDLACHANSANQRLNSREPDAFFLP